MRRTAIVLVLLGMLAALTATTSASATWVDQHCGSDWQDISYWKRVDSRAYALVAVGEGYEMGGGCWNDNDRDDTPADDDNANSGAEGPDCSGLTFKAWKLRPNQGADGGRSYGRLMNIHGPYHSDEYRAPHSGWPFATIGKSNMLPMDALAKNGHVALLYTVSTSRNTDIVLEAVGGSSSPAIGVFERDYRSQSAYKAARRDGWTADCWPRCAAQAPGVSVVEIP
jgi:hypothetical protein